MQLNIADDTCITCIVEIYKHSMYLLKIWFTPRCKLDILAIFNPILRYQFLYMHYTTIRENNSS